MSALKSRLLIVALAVAVFVIAGWVVGHIVSIVWLVGATARFGRARRALNPSITCPDGHVVPQYGRYSCAVCHAVTDGWAWECSLCGARSGWLACPTCGLATRSPL